MFEGVPLNHCWTFSTMANGKSIDLQYYFVRLLTCERYGRYSLPLDFQGGFRGAFNLFHVVLCMQIRWYPGGYDTVNEERERKCIYVISIALENFAHAQQLSMKKEMYCLPFHVFCNGATILKKRSTGCHFAWNRCKLYIFVKQAKFLMLQSQLSMVLSMFLQMRQP